MSNPRKIVFANAIIAMKYSSELREIGLIMRKEALSMRVFEERDFAELLYRTAVRIKVKYLAKDEAQADTGEHDE